MNSLNWEDIKYLVQVYRYGTIAAAAKSLKVEHSTVVRHLTRLEASLDVRLFNRLTRGWTFTDVGGELAQRSLEMERTALAIQRFALATSDLVGRVRLSAPPVLLSDVVIPALSGLPERYPGIELIVLSEMAETNLSQGEADIAIRLTELSRSQLVAKTLCRIRYGLYARPFWADVPVEERRYIGPVLGKRSLIAQTMDKHLVGRKVVMRSNDLRVIFEAVRSGIGVGLLPYFMTRNDPDLQIVEDLPKPVGCSVKLVMQHDVRHSARVRAVADFLSATVPGVLALSRVKK